MAKPSSKPDLSEARNAARLAEALTLLCCEHAAAHQLSTSAIVGSLTLALARIVGRIARDGRGRSDLNRFVEFVSGQLLALALDEFKRQPFTIH